MEGRGREDQLLLSQEERASLTLLRPLVFRHLDLILETLVLQLGSDPCHAWLLESSLAVERLQQSQRQYLLDLLTTESPGQFEGGNGHESAYQDPFGLGAGWHLRSLTHFATALQPLVHEQFADQPSVHRTVWSALLKVVFRELELVMEASLGQRDEYVEAVGQEDPHGELLLNTLMPSGQADEDQHLLDELKFIEEVTAWRANVCSLAREMGTPLNVILGHAESLLGKTDNPVVQAALQCILKQVERMILLRQPLCTLDYGLRSRPSTLTQADCPAEWFSYDQEKAGHRKRGLP